MFHVKYVSRETEDLIFVSFIKVSLFYKLFLIEGDLKDKSNKCPL